MIDIIKLQLDRIRSTRPVIMNLTNFVTMDFIANSLLAIGAAPIMTNSREEVEELVNISSSIYINIGTLDNDFYQMVLFACEIAKKNNKPIILDPVGSGASRIRTNSSKDLAKIANIIRGNASEIISLVDDQKFISSGVETSHKSAEAYDYAVSIAKQNHNIVSISGEIDFITDGNQSSEVPFGNPIMQNVTGMGCVLTAQIAAFAAVSDNYFDACAIAMNFYALAGEIVAMKTDVPGSFKQQFIDFLNKPDFEEMKKLYEMKVGK